jgi:hypothetical protein
MSFDRGGLLANVLEHPPKSEANDHKDGKS